MIDWISDFYFEPNPTTWDAVLLQRYAFLPRWWAGSRRRAGGRPPDWYQVWIGTGRRAVILGDIHRNGNGSGWRTDVYHADMDAMSQDDVRRTFAVPASMKAWEAERDVRLGTFKTRQAAADVLKGASIDRGRLRDWRRACLDAVTLLGDVA